MFDWDMFFTEFKTRLEKATDCTVGRYVIPREDEFPYVDVSVGDNYGIAYDLRGYENAQAPLIVINVYDTGDLAYSTCISISEEAKKIMLSYGFRCQSGPMEIANADATITRWVGRYQRNFAAGDTLRQINYSDLL